MQDKYNPYITTFTQCQFGARTSKPTRFLHTLKLPLRWESCQHERRWWKMPWSGETFYAAHPPLMGTQWAIEATILRPYMLRDRPPKGPYISKQAAMYTRDMNMMIMTAFKKHHENHESVATLLLHGCRDLPESSARRLKLLTP